jgi:hypothetical protein
MSDLQTTLVALGAELTDDERAQIEALSPHAAPEQYDPALRQKLQRWADDLGPVERSELIAAVDAVEPEVEGHRIRLRDEGRHEGSDPGTSGGGGGRLPGIIWDNSPIGIGWNGAAQGLRSFF